MPGSLAVLRRALALAAMAALSACSGGGGDDSPDPASASGIAITPTSLSFFADAGDFPPPAAQAIQITISDPAAAYVGARTRGGNAFPAWLAPSLTGAGSSWSFFANITSTGLAPGTYSETLQIGILRNDQTTVIAYREATVTYTVAPNLIAFPTLVDLTYVQGGPPPSAQMVFLSGSTGSGWTASADQPWVLVDATAGIVPVNVGIGVDPTGLGTGTHTASVTFTGSGKVRAVVVQLTVLAP
jgi:hypothetical protein